jgi:hypothetical protein
LCGVTRGVIDDCCSFVLGRSRPGRTITERKYRRILAMSCPGSTLQCGERDLESSGRHRSDVAQGAETKDGAFDYQKRVKGGPTMDCQTRMKTFDHVKGSPPVASFGGRPHGGPLNDPWPVEPACRNARTAPWTCRADPARTGAVGRGAARLLTAMMSSCWPGGCSDREP